MQLGSADSTSLLLLLTSACLPHRSAAACVCVSCAAATTLGLRQKRTRSASHWSSAWAMETQVGLAWTYCGCSRWLAGVLAHGGCVGELGNVCCIAQLIWPSPPLPAAAAAAADSDSEPGTPAVSRHITVSRFMPTSRRIVQVPAWVVLGLYQGVGLVWGLSALVGASATLELP